MVRLLGELYNYSIVNSPIIFETLYHLINFGHEVPAYMKMPQPNPDPARQGEMLPPLLPAYVTHDPRVFFLLDQPMDNFRADLVCVLLNTSGTYFAEGKTRGKLDRFLTFFQRYLYSKTSIR